MLVEPTNFPDAGPPITTVVIACTYDPLGLQGPLSVWLRQTGLRCDLHWIAFGSVLDAIRDLSSVWSRNHAGLNVLLLRDCDLGDDTMAADLFAAARPPSTARADARAPAARGAEMPPWSQPRTRFATSPA